ncbi:MAG TPA: hypothetical protein VJW20_07785 [Candidatus Angelobacter sp.]|nr:hypothetical protein [Candidatus Angelobacter sp.]
MRPVYAIGALLLLIAGGYALRHTPVLLHLFAETDCACGDLHAEVTGLIVRNPLRDHAPEQSAARFLGDLRNGNCDEPASECEYDLEHRVADWKLAYRRDHGDTVELYYKLTKYGETDPQHALTGEGTVTVAYAQGAWNVVRYSSYF